MDRHESRPREENSKDGSARQPDPIRHVICLMLENRSFDQMLGSLQAVYPDLDGVPEGGPLRTNRDIDGQVIEQAPAADTRMKGDPKHELPNCLHQLSDNNGNFVRDYAEAYPHSDEEERKQVMAYFPLDKLPALHQLGRSFRVCDRWFSSIPGATWPNRLFVHSGTSIGKAKMPHGVFDLAGHRYWQDTIYDRLNEKGIPWNIYFGDFPQSMLLEHQWKPENAHRYRPLDQFFRDACGPARNFPAYCFLEPRYYAPGQNDDHPPHDVGGAQRLVADVYNAIRANEDLWKSSLLVVVYDEHGGFYDHVSPPAAVPPDEHRDDYTFDRLGVRVPALLVSPWVGPGVEHTTFDHTSLLKYLIEKWELGPLGERAARANSIAVALRTGDEGGAPRDDAPEKIDVPEPAPDVPDPSGLNELQMAMIALALFLETRTPGDAQEKMNRLKSMMENPAAQVKFATGAIKRFIGHAKEEWRAEAARLRGDTKPARKKVVIDKGHPGVGGEGRAHRKKVTLTKVRNKKKVAAKKGQAR
jgi:phospholipase C